MLLDALTDAQPDLQLLRRRAGDVANELIDRAAERYGAANAPEDAGEKDAAKNP